MIRIKRVYDPPESDDGPRFLVDRLWPRGVKREALPMDAWLKDVAPSEVLRRQFHHDPARWDEFRHAYAAELDGKPEAWRPILKTARWGNVTLLYSARDKEHNNAAVLKAYVEERLRGEAK